MIPIANKSHARFQSGIGLPANVRAAAARMSLCHSHAQHEQVPQRYAYPSRRASVYIMVLGLVLIMMAAGAASIAMSRARAGTLSQQNDTIRAEAIAESAMEYGTLQIKGNPLWRILYTNNVETPQSTFGGGKLSYKLVDETDGSLNNGATNPVRVYGIGRYGSAIQSCSVVVSGTTALSCLNAPLVVGRNLNFNQDTLTASGATIVANGNMTDSSSGSNNTLTCNLEAGGTISLNKHTVTGTQLAGTALVTKRAMPTVNVFDYYIAKGVTIPVTSLPVDNSNGGRKIEKIVLSPANNPFTSTLDTDGIYVIPCNGVRVNILNSRIVGTLVLLNPGPGSCCGLTNGDSINWTSAITNFPCLLVKGDFSIAFGNAAGTFSESSASVNLNPTGTPYPYFTGTSNTTTTDTLTNAIDGLVYISGNLTGGNSTTYPRVNMLIVGNDYDAQKDNSYPSFRDVYTNSPPPGFCGSGSLAPIAGTYRKELAP